MGIKSIGNSTNNEIGHPITSNTGYFTVVNHQLQSINYRAKSKLHDYPEKFVGKIFACPIIDLPKHCNEIINCYPVTLHSSTITLQSPLSSGNTFLIYKRQMITI